MQSTNSIAQRPRDIGLAVRRFFVFVLPLVAIIGFIGVNSVISMLAPKPEKKETIVKATPVVAVAATSKPVTLSVKAQGEANPRVQINLASNVSGRINYVSPAFIEGGAFKAGDVLVSIEDDEFGYRVTEARSSVAQMQSRFASEQAQAEAARFEFNDIGDGRPQNEASDLTLRKPQMAEAAAMLASARASLKAAELQLARTKIRAPFDGRVTEKMVDVGEFIAPGSALGRIFSTSVMEVRLPLTDNDLSQLDLMVGFVETQAKRGPTVQLSSIVGGRASNWTGRIVRADSSFDPQTRALFVYVGVEDPYGAGADDGIPLAAGLFVNAEIEGRRLDQAVLVPRTAIRGDGQVFIARDDNTLEIRDVIIAQSQPDGAVLSGGLKPGERVITSPVRSPATGMAIAIAGDPVDPPSSERVADTQS